MTVAAVFLDLDGVLSHTATLTQEYLRLMGDVLVPAIGGTSDDWARANAATFPTLFAEAQAWVGDPVELANREYAAIVQRMCEWLTIEAPSAAESAEIGRSFNLHVRRMSASAFPTASAVVRQLASTREVHMATGNPSWLTEAFLNRLGVRDLVGHACGPDLVGHLKRSAEFYPSIFRLARADPAASVVVDDAPDALARARAAGAMTVLVEPLGHAAAPHIDRVIGGISELPATVAALATL